MTEKTVHNISYSFIPKGSAAGSVEYQFIHVPKDAGSTPNA